MKRIVALVLVVVAIVFFASCSGEKYSTDKVSVTFFTANSGSTLVEKQQGLEPNSLIEEPADPVREGFVFTGWYTDYHATEAWDFDTDRIGDKSIIIYAGWTADVYDIVYDLNGGEMISSEYVTQFSPGDYEVLPQAYRQGFLFVAWYTYDWEDASSTIPGDSGMQILPDDVFGTLYLYAHYEPIEVRVTFRANYPIEGEGPENPSPAIVNYGDIIDFPDFEDTDLYSFVGWNVKKDGTGDFYVDGDPFIRTQRIYLYAVWELK